MSLYERCKQLPFSLFQELIEEAGGGAYLIDPSVVTSNSVALSQSAKSRYANTILAYSYKTNYNKALIGAARGCGAYSEVVSQTEYEYARLLGVPDSEIIFNGPGKSSNLLSKVAAKPITLIVDSVGELHRLEQLVLAGLQLSAKIGLRVCPKLPFQTRDSRFGIDLNDEENQVLIRRLITESKWPIHGIQLHYTEDRSASSYEQRLSYLLASWDSLQIGPPGFIDCGGGFASPMPTELEKCLSYTVDRLPTYGEVIGASMRRRFPNENVLLILEPGTGILADAGVYVSPVLDVKNLGERDIAIVDGTYLSVNPLRSSLQVVAKICESKKIGSTDKNTPVTVYGNSCMETDILLDQFHGRLAPGDILVFAQKGAYASSMASAFIQGIPALACLETDNKLSILRQRQGAQLLSILN